MRFAFTGSTFSSGGGCLFAFTPSKNSFTWVRTIVLFSSSDLSYGNFSRGLRDDGPYLYCFPPLVVLLDAGADGVAAAYVFFHACLRGRGEGVGRAGAAGRRRVSSALAGEAEKEDAAGFSGAPAQAEKEAECRHAPEKEAEWRHAPEKEAECRHACPDRHSPEEEAGEEAECPNSPEQEEEAEASSSKG